MKKLLVATFLTAMTIMMAQGTNSTFAQTKKKATAKVGTIELIESKDGKYRFSVRDVDGKYVGGSAVGHATEKEAREAAEELKSVLETAVYVSKKSEKSDEADKEDEPKKKKTK